MRRWMVTRGDAGGRACMVAAAFVVPLVFIPSTLDQFSMVKLATLWALGIAGLACWVVWSSERRSWLPPARLVTAASLFVAVAAVATAVSQIPQVSMIGLYGRYGGLLPLALYVAMAFVIIGVFWESPERLRALAWAPVAASPLLAAYVIAQAKDADFIRWGLTRPESARIAARLVQYPVGTMGNSNFAGGYLGIVFPLLLCALAYARRPVTRAVLVAIGGMDAVALWYTGSRGGLVAAGAGTIVVVVLLGSWRHALLRLWAVIFVLALGLASVVVFSNRFDTNTRAPAAEGFLRTDTLVSRTWYWQAALEIVSDHPMLGTGPDTFYANYPSHRRAEDGAQFGLVLADEPHNIVLNHASSLGLVGVAAYLTLIGLAGVSGVRRVPHVEGLERTLLVGFLGMLAAYIGQGMFSIDVPALAFAGWVAIAGIAVLADPVILRARKSQARASAPGAVFDAEALPAIRRERRESRWGSRWLLQAVVLVVAVPVAAAGAAPVLADHDARTAVTDARVAPADSEVGRDAAVRAIDLAPWEAAYRAVAGDVAEHQAEKVTDPAGKRLLLQRALARYGQAARMRPRHIYYMINVARVTTTLATQVDPTKFPVAERAWRRVVDLDHTDWEVHNSYALMLNAWSNARGGDQALRRRVAAELEEVVRIRPRDPGAWTNLARVAQAVGDPSRARSAAQKALALAPGNADATAVLNGLPGG